MAAGDTYQRISPHDQWILDSSGDLAGARVASKGEEVRFGAGSGGAASGTLVSVPNGGAEVVSTPASAASTVAMDTVIVALAGTTGSYSQTGHTMIGVLPPMRQSSGAFVTLTRYTYDEGLTWYLRGVLPGESIGEWAWADLKALSATTYAGCTAEVTGIVSDYDGAGTARSVTLIARNGRWRPASGRLPLRMQAAPTTAHANTSLTSAAVIAIPDDFLAANDAYVIKSAVNKVNDNGTGSITFYVGRNGTTADTAVSAYTLAPSPNTSNSWGGEGVIKIDTDTTARQLGNGLPTVSFVGSNTNQAPTAVAIDSITGGVINLTIGTAVANAADTISLSTLIVELITG